MADLSEYTQAGTYQVPVTIYIDGYPDAGVIGDDYKIVVVLEAVDNVDCSYLSAQEAPEIQSAWFQKENGYRQRPQGPGSPSCQGQSKAVRLIFDQTMTAYTARFEP